MKLTKEQFWNEWELQFIKKITAGEEVISEVKFALPKGSHDKAWELMNNGQIDFDEILKVAEEFDMELMRGLNYRLIRKSVNQKRKVE